VEVNKRSAIVLAGSVTGAMVSGVAGYSVSLNRPAEAAAPAKPIVRTEIRTITIHRKAKPRKVKAAPAPTIVIRRPSSAQTHSAPPPAHHTGGSTHQGDDGEGDGGGGD
jgi:hypothetical protein